MLSVVVTPRSRAPERTRYGLWAVAGLLCVVGAALSWWIGGKGQDSLDRIRAPRPESGTRTYLADPIDIEVAPLVSALEWGKAAATPDAPRRHSGKLAGSDGKPIVGAEYWLLPAQPLPDGELRGDLPKASLWKPAVPPLGTTDAASAFAGFLPADATPLLVARLHRSLVVATAFRPDETVALTELGSYEIGVQGLAPKSTLRVAVTPAFPHNRLLRRGWAKARDIVMPTAVPGRGYALLSSELTFSVGGEQPLRIAWPNERAADLGFDGLGFDVVPASQVVETGARLEARLGRRFRTVRIVLPEPVRAEHGGFAVLSFRPDPSEARRREDLEAGAATFDLRATEDATYVLDVVDGVTQHYHAEFKESELPANGVFEVGAATAVKPFRLRVPVREGLASAQIWCEKADRIFVPLTTAAEYTFLVDEYGCVANPRPGEYLLADAPRDWRQLFVVLANGEVARASSELRREVVGEWLPSVALPPQDLGVLAKKYFGSRPGEVFFQIDLPSLDSEPQEVRCDHVSVPRHLARTPSWTKRVPQGYAARLVFLVPNEVFETLELTEPRK